MARWINRHFKLWIWIAVFLVAAAGIAGMWLHFRGIWVLCIAIAIAAVYELYEAPKQENRAVARSLDEHCDPDPLLVSSLELRALCCPDRSRELDRWLSYSLNAFTALLGLGRLEEAEALKAEIAPRAGRSMSPVLQSAYALQMAAFYLMRGQPDEALPWIQEDSLAVERLPRQSISDSYRHSLENLCWVYQFLTEGPSQAFLEAALRQTASAPNLCVQVHAHMNAASCLLDLNRPEEARPHLEFVAANGNKLAIRAEAEARLAALAAT